MLQKRNKVTHLLRKQRYIFGACRFLEVLKVGDSVTIKEMKRLSRADLLELLIDQSEELNELRARLDAAETALKNREIAISKSGTMAEAALLLNGVFEAAQAACDQYLENIRMQAGQGSAVPSAERPARKYRSRKYDE